MWYGVNYIGTIGYRDAGSRKMASGHGFFWVHHLPFLPIRTVGMKKLSDSEMESPSEQTFEEAIAALEQCVRKLEGNSLGLEQSLEEYAKAVRFVTHCQLKLSQAKQKIEQLKSMSKSGETTTVSWEETETKSDTPTTRRRKTEP